jgi:hypothetical protein
VYFAVKKDFLNTYVDRGMKDKRCLCEAIYKKVFLNKY